MGIMTALTGNATEVTAESVTKELASVLIQGESVKRCYKVVRDMFVFTSKRMILVDKQGISGKKISYHSVPYASITHFEVETAGRFDMDAELRVWVSGSSEPISKTLKKGVDIVSLQRTLATVAM